jgi:hypothetical protein
MEKQTSQMTDEELQEFATELRMIYSSPQTLRSRFSTKISAPKSKANEVSDEALGI